MAIPPVVAEALDPSRFHLILFVTEQCNFRCTYCYEDFKLGLMRPEVVAGVKSLLTNRIGTGTLRHLQIGWFGGEPLLAKSIICDVMDFVKGLAVGVTSNITTNGYFLDLATFNRLTDLGIRKYQISLDGDSELHNRSRVAAGGGPTFDRIWRNLSVIRSESTAEAELILRVHYQLSTWSLLSPLIDRINREFSDDTRFRVYFKSVEQLGGPNDASIGTLSDAAKEEVAGRLKSRLLNPAMAFHLDKDGPYVCYASKANSLAIRADGAINKCTVALNDDQNRIGHLNSDGTLTIDQARLRIWLQGLESLDPKTLSCPYSKLQNRIKRDSLRHDLPVLQAGSAELFCNSAACDLKQKTAE